MLLVGDACALLFSVPPLIFAIALPWLHEKYVRLMLTLKVLQHSLPTVLLPLTNVQEWAQLVLVR